MPEEVQKYAETHDVYLPPATERVNEVDSQVQSDESTDIQIQEE